VVSNGTERLSRRALLAASAALGISASVRTSLFAPDAADAAALLAQNSVPSDETMFGGSPVADFPCESPGQAAPWVRAFEAAFIQLTSTPEGRELYGDPNRGATLVQAWRAVQLIGIPPRVCLLVSSYPGSLTGQGITEVGGSVIPMEAQELVDGLAQLFTWDKRAFATAFTFAGRTGHCVALLGTDPDGQGFTFHDPWPCDSLLSNNQDMPGVNAQRVGSYWHITAAELTGVVVAAFVAPNVWAEVTGQPGRISFPALQSTNFWSFFNLHEKSREARDPANVDVILGTGGDFADEIEVRLTLNERSLINTAELRLRESWLIGPPLGLNPFATDIAASFLDTLAPPIDQAQIRPIAEAIREFRLDTATQARLADQRFVSSAAGRALQAYAGVGSDELYLPMTGSVLIIDTQTIVDQPWRSLRIVSI